MQYGDNQPKPSGTWDYQGECLDSTTNYSNVSASIFMWIEKSAGKGTKKSKSEFRISGNDSNKVRAMAEASVAVLNQKFFNQ